MFSIFWENENTIKYSTKNLEKDIIDFITIFNEKLNSLEVSWFSETENKELIKVIKDFTIDLKEKYVFIVLYPSELNTLIDYNEDSKNQIKKFQVSNIEDFIFKLEKNLLVNFERNYHDKYSGIFNQISIILTNSLFEYIEHKRQIINNIKIQKNVSISYKYFGSLYRVKPLYENLTIDWWLDFRPIHKQIFNTLDREWLEKMQIFLAGVLNNYLQWLTSNLFSPEIITAITYNSKNFIETINNDYISTNKDNTNPKNILSIDECLWQKYLPLFNAPDKVKTKDTNQLITINKAVIVTTLEAILNRYKWNIWNDIDELWYSLSHFGNMIETYDDENLFKKFIILSNDDWQKFFDYVTFCNKAFDEVLSPDKKKQRKLEEADIWTGETKKEFDLILLKAILMKATDIHLKIFEGQGMINFRTNTWIIITDDKIPKERIIKIIRMLSWDSKVNEFGLDIPQDWEQHRIIEDKKTNVKYEVDLRFWFAQWLERVYIRLWAITNNWKRLQHSLLELWYEDEDLEIIHWMLENNSNGLILVTWPTWSWKTTLLYWILEYQIPNRPEVHLLTAEDPIERELIFPNVEQNRITEKASSKVLLKSFLRQDPDWILIWETRDKELLSMVIEASQTWHLTFSTYHTNNTIETLDRLSKMYSWDNVENFWLARDSLLSVLRWIISVILVPKLCPHCKTEAKYEEVLLRIKKKWISDDRIEKMLKKDWTFFKRKPDGCWKCDLWFKWKQTINEIMNLSNQVTLEEVKKHDYSNIIKQFEKWMKYVNQGIIDIDTIAKNASK